MAKVCKQCGEERPNEQYREYYGGRRGRYTTCKVCEKINSRCKYLTGKGAKRTETETAELDKIHELYELQRTLGFRPPRVSTGRTVPIIDTVDSMLGPLRERVEAASDQLEPSMVSNDELMHWLTLDLTDSPEYYLEEVYEALKTKFRPVLRIGDDMLPEYDDTYKPVLDKILDRFNQYEDTYYND